MKQYPNNPKALNNQKIITKMKIYLYITTLFIAISIMSCASTKNKAYKGLRKHYINTAELDTIMGIDQLPIQYLEFEKTFPEAD